MNSLRSRRFLSWVLVLWALLILLPPGAWALCVGPDGHLAFEPGVGACADREPAAERASDAECSASDCDPCEDVPVLRGLALLPDPPVLDAPPLAVPGLPLADRTPNLPCVVPAPEFTKPLHSLSRSGSLPLLL